MNRLARTETAGGVGALPSRRVTAVVTALLVAPALLSAFWPALTVAMVCDRARIASGEVWRLLTGHWTHWSPEHLGWDLLAFAVLVPLSLRVSATRTFATLALSALLIPLAVHVALPRIVEYRGLSGLDSALFVLLGTVLFRRHAAGGDRAPAFVSALALAGFGAKLAFEMATGTTVFVETAGFVPVPLAHVVGGLVGMLIGSTAPVARRVHGFSRAARPRPRAS